HFTSTEPSYMEEFRARLKKAKSSMNQINVEFGALNISATDPVVRLETIDLTKKWIDHAVILGCPRVMVNQGTLAPDVRQAAIDTLRRRKPTARTKKATSRRRTAAEAEEVEAAAGPQPPAPPQPPTAPLPPSLH